MFIAHLKSIVKCKRQCGPSISRQAAVLGPRFCSAIRSRGIGGGLWSDSQQHPWDTAVPGMSSLLFKKGIGDTGYLPLPVRWEIMRREPEVRGGAENPSCRFR